MQKVIGLDIGSYSIKAVEITNSFKSYEITNFYENVIPNVDELDPDVVIPACMEQLFTENNLKADRIITAMPGQYISSRIMTFGFTDARKIQTAVMAEVEDAVPFNMDDMIVDHQVLGTKNNETMALVVMTRKSFLGSFLEHLQRIDIDPKLVDIDSLAFYNLSSYIEMDPGEVYALVDVGHEKTSVCIVQDNVLRMFRSINLGGRYITEFLARDMECGFAEAQRVKHRVSQVIVSDEMNGNLSGDDKIIAERMTLAANAIVKELGRTIYAFKTWEKSPINKVFLSGGSSKIRDFSKYLEVQLEIPVVQNRIDNTDLKIETDLSDYMEVIPQSVAIGMRGTTSLKRHSQINLRQGEFAYIQNYESILRIAGTAVKVVAIALLLLTVSYGVKRMIYSQQIGELQDQYLKQYTSVFPSEKKKYKAGRFTFSKLRSDVKTKLTSVIDKKQTAINLFVAQNSASPALTILREISEKMPKDLKLNVTTYEYNQSPNGEGRVKIKGQTDSYETVEKIADAIKKVPSLKNVENAKSSPVPGTDNKVIEFTIPAQFIGFDEV